MKEQVKVASINDYISNQPVEIRPKLQEIREIIKSVIPDATEVISYNMPAFKQKSVLVYFAGYKNHIGFYPTGSGIAEFENELGAYKYSKGAIQFPHDKKLPVGLIKRIVKFRARQDALKK